jgi:hypothetical protein
MNKMPEKSVRKLSVGLFFSIFMLVGLNSYKDYGMSWDEQSQRYMGSVTVKYLAEIFSPSLVVDYSSITSRIAPLHEYGGKDYGVAFEATAVALEALFKIDDSRDIYMFRHLLTFLIFFCGVYAFYRLVYRRYINWKIGLLAALFFILSPRIFAESFYNSKDVVFMALFTIAMNATISFLTNIKLKTAFLCALATAIAIDVRIMGSILVVSSIAVIMIDFLKKERPLKVTIQVLFFYLITTSVLVITMWPYLWESPIDNFLTAFQNMSRFRVGVVDFTVLYMGEFVSATELPWHYILVWISITTPILYLVLFGIGAFSTMRQIIFSRFRIWRNKEELQDAFFLGMFVLPIIAVIYLNSVLYDGWRQMYFLYPALLLVSIRGWVFIWNYKLFKNVNKIILFFLTSVSVIYVSGWMWKEHPLQNVYFNKLAGNNIKYRYELDYWGLGNRRALEYILANDKDESINVWADSETPINRSFLMLQTEDRGRIYTDKDKAPNYIFTNYRLVKDPDRLKNNDNYELFYKHDVGGVNILSVFKLKDNI